jgi:RHS repeat-associated protein
MSYVYDSNGKVIQKTGTFAGTNLPGALASATYNANNQLTVRAATSYTYDLNGNLKTDGLNTYTWNDRNQMASIAGGTPANSRYDALGRRVIKTGGGITTGFLYDEDQPIEEFSGTTPTATLLTGPGVDEIYSRTDSLGVRFFLTDLQGSTIAITDSTGTIQSSYTYEPFGATSSGGAGTNSFQYDGRENDGGGLYYYRSRYYAPGIERFISEDPIGFGGGSNAYAYVGNDPIDFVDPFGMRRRKRRPSPPPVLSGMFARPHPRARHLGGRRREGRHQGLRDNRQHRPIGRGAGTGRWAIGG